MEADGFQDIQRIEPLVAIQFRRTYCCHLGIRLAVFAESAILRLKSFSLGARVKRSTDDIKCKLVSVIADGREDALKDGRYSGALQGGEHWCAVINSLNVLGGIVQTEKQSAFVHAIEP